MKMTSIALALCVAAASADGAPAQEGALAQPALSYQVVPDFLKLPENLYMAEVVGVATDSRGQIYVLNRGKQPILQFNPDGTFVRSIGEGLPFEGPHSLRVDPQDNLWYVDAANNFVMKFDTQKRLQMVLGRRPEPWTWLTHVIERAATPPPFFYQPTDVTWGPDGAIYVSDGYGNSRVAKFDKSGNLVKQWGQRGTAPGEFNTPHSIVIDANNNLYVADRANARIQVFDTEGNFKKEIRFGGPPWSLCLTRGPNPVMYVGSVGRIVKLSLDGKVLGTMGKFGKVPGMFDWVHGVACPDEHTVYVAQELGFRLDKLVVE